MGEHFTWFDLLAHSEGWQNLFGTLKHTFERHHLTEVMPTHFGLNHVLFAIVVMLFIIWGGAKFAKGSSSPDGIVPPKKFNLRNLFEVLCNAIFGLMSQVMGEKNAKTYMPLIGSLALFILFSNLLALIPGMGVPSTSLNTNLALGGLVFVIYNVAGIREHGVVNYVKHFMGPSPVLAPLMFPIEIISHVARPASLALRLLGNMSADHKVVFTFATLVPLIVPVPFLMLGLLVCVVQTLVFCLLAMVYISMAVAHDH